MDYNKNYLERYNKLNNAQKRAVDTTEGPVMVIAGPGTGKTEVLGMRIANLLRSSSQIAPHEILCLTYTDEAAHNMRKRLHSIVGLPAQKVNIYTFHGFCNNIIQNHSEYFGYRPSEPINDLERTELLQSILEKLPPKHPMYRIGSSTFYDLKPLNSFFTEMKKENWDSKLVKTAVSEYLNDLPNRDDFKYQRKSGNNNKGDLKTNEIKKAHETMQRTIAAAELFDEYNNRLRQNNRYDYADMLLWVIDAFKKDDYLLQHYQERFQYILVDEFQDTNGAQNEILNLLTNYWGDNANIFVVGDDDQSIYEFQGARIHNIIEFHERYKRNITTIVLTENYRSSPAILDKAMRSIANNQERLIKKLAHLNLDKIISAALPQFATNGPIPNPQIIKYPNPAQEIVAVVQSIEHLLAVGSPPGEIAVLYSQFKQAEALIALLERKKINYTCSRSINVLDEVLPLQIKNIITYLAQESKKSFSGEAHLFDLMHCPYFGIAPQDIAQLSLYLSSKEAKEKNIRHWRQLFAHEIILTQLSLTSLQAILKLARQLDQWIQQLHILRIPMLVEKIVYESGMLHWALGSEDAAMQTIILQSFYSFVSSVSKAQTTVVDFLSILEKMQQEGIKVPLSKISKSEKGIKLYTVHSAKGLEFEHVFVIGVNKKFWESKSGGQGQISLPDTLTRTSNDNDNDYKIEVARRLFFVAITRAKLHLNISFAEYDNEGKGLEESCYINEILGDDKVQAITVSEERFLSDLRYLMQPVEPVYIKLVDRELIEQQLENFALSPSSLSKYLRCPISFYYEDVLRIPVAENDSMAFGTAVHYALERAFIAMSKDPAMRFPDTEEVLGYFRYKMREKEVAFTPLQYERRMEKGIEIIGEYYEHNRTNFLTEVQLEKWLQGTVGNTPIKGKIDKIELLPDQHCRVIDYKTGNADSKKNKDNLAAPNEKNQMQGGDYWRQMVFYKILIESQPFNRLIVSEGRFDYVEKVKDQYFSPKIIILPQDKEIVVQQIQESYIRIKNQEFDQGCGSKDCKWCSFVKNKQLALTPSFEEE